MDNVNAKTALPSAVPGRPAAGAPLGHRGLALGLILVGQLLVIIDGSIVTLALPAIQRGLGFSPGALQWVISAYALAFGGFLLLGGRLADLLGRRAVLMSGVGVFTAASLACGLAGSPGVLVAARAAEGLGAAMIAPAAMSLIVALFPEGPERNRALGALGAVGGAGAAVGVLAGGMLTTWLSWRWIFFINLPVGGLVVAAARPLLPESRADLGHHRFDVAGAVTVTAGLSLLVYAVVTASSHGWASATTTGLLAGAAALVAAFIVIEARSAAPLLPLGFFGNRAVTAANLAGLLLGGAMSPTFVFLSLYLQQVLGYSPVLAGLALVVTAVGLIVSSGLAQGLVTRAGARLVLTAGTLGFAAAQVLFIRLPATGGYTTHLLPGLMIVAAGLGLAYVADVIASASGVKAAEAGLASGLINASQQTGGAIGLAISTTVAANSAMAALHAGHTHAVALTGGYHDAFAIAGALALAAAIAAATLP
jgi:EmrB/QacA subfamily drug resistance transporter